MIDAACSAIRSANRIRVPADRAERVVGHRRIDALGDVVVQLEATA